MQMVRSQTESMVTLKDIQSARELLRGVAVRTPLVSCKLPDQKQIFFKPENLQPVGSFKLRGAYNKISSLSAEERARGVVAHSSGNHAQGAAYAARALGVRAVIVMPSNAPEVKLEATRALGAEIVLVGAASEDRIQKAEELEKEHGLVPVPPYNDEKIIAGQGTIGLEILEDLNDVAVVLAPVGGGGLISGIATAVKALSPSTAIVGVEPEGFDDTLKSLQKGERIVQKPTTRSLCDALESPFCGELTFPIMLKTVAGMVTVSDHEVTDAMRFAFSTLKLAVEPGGAVALAALLAGKLETFGGSTAALVLSGGNVDPDQFAQVIRGEI